MLVASPEFHGYFKETRHAAKVSIIRFKGLSMGLVTHGHFLLRNLNLQHWKRPYYNLDNKRSGSPPSVVL